MKSPLPKTWGEKKNHSLSSSKEKEFKPRIRWTTDCKSCGQKKKRKTLFEKKKKKNWTELNWKKKFPALTKCYPQNCGWSHFLQSLQRVSTKLCWLLISFWSHNAQHHFCTVHIGLRVALSHLLTDYYYANTCTSLERESFQWVIGGKKSKWHFKRHVAELKWDVSNIKCWK